MSSDSQAFEMSLRDQLIAAQNNHHSAQSQAPPAPPVSAPDAYGQPQNQQSTHHHLDTTMGVQSYGMHQQGPELPQPHHGPANTNPQGPGTAKKGRAQRELSNTKRAAQNRAAQRAFRLRKEQHIGKLESDLKEYRIMEDNFKTLQHEMFTLRVYIDTLHTIMADKHLEYPPAPPQLPLRPVSLSTAEDHQDHEHPFLGILDHEQPDDQHHYPDMSSSVQHHEPHAYPVSNEPSHHHDASVAVHATHQASADDPLPAAAISQLQAAAAQAGDMGSSHTSSAPPHHDPPHQAHPQDPQYVRASESPAHKRPRLDDPPHDQQPPATDKPPV